MSSELSPWASESRKTKSWWLKPAQNQCGGWSCLPGWVDLGTALGCPDCRVKKCSKIWEISPLHRDPEFVFYDQLKQVMNAYRYGIALAMLGCCLTPWQELLQQFHVPFSLFQGQASNLWPAPGCLYCSLPWCCLCCSAGKRHWWILFLLKQIRYRNSHSASTKAGITMPLICALGSFLPF